MLRWFHATSRSGANEYVEVLRNGLKPSPKKTKTKQIEIHFGFEEPRVYCYLGRTLELFGDFCVVLTPEKLPDGQMSPFDTGGIKNNTPPVSSWAQEQQIEYLNGWTFETSERATLLERYPAARIVEYLSCERPLVSGPHAVLDGPKADIWKDATNDWRAWTWEGRWSALPADSHVHAWSCSPALFSRILDVLDSESVEFTTRLLDCFRDGGVGALVQAMREEQTHA